MKLKLIIFPLCLIVLNAFGFEGTIKQEVKNYNGTGTNITMTWYLGAHNCRIDMAQSGKDINSNSVLLLDPATQTFKTYNLNVPGPKNYFQVKASDITGSLSIVSVIATQEEKQINGYKCEKWVVVASSGTYNVWITKGIDFDWAAYKDFFKTNIEVQALIHQNVKGFPMLTESATGSGSSAVETVTAQALTSETFTVPADYTLYVDPQQQTAPATKTK
jgi:hypothetical protein